MISHEVPVETLTAHEHSTLERHRRGWDRVRQAPAQPQPRRGQSEV